ncbi:TIGR03085 family protein [Nocardia sp. ET3-3]|uniref:TIGR03085 family protein n=1 Tax=Nocardia terrae TaxID=2675851 RepID=A0A7K1V161_9NOCA|nr:TIGR03085 family metal-binding protein [Nocardia terrae]MVU80380.1 TIGR03085 family protein [Nocardia terrae]
MGTIPFDAQEREALCDLFEELGADAPTLLEGWTARDLAAHLVLRERDILAGPCMVLPGPFARFADRRRANLVAHNEFGWLVDRLRSGPPAGFFRLGWVRSFPSLNEFFVHHEDLRRANGLGPRHEMPPALQDALWRNVRRGGRFLSRRLRGVRLDLERAGTGERVTVRRGEPAVRLRGAPGELLLYLFGRQDAAEVEALGPAPAVDTVGRTRFGM